MNAPFLIGTLCLFLGIAATKAERFLTVVEYQKLCFPSATRFEPGEQDFSADDLKRIQQDSGTKPRGKKLTYILAWQGTNLAGVLLLDGVIGKHELIDYGIALDTKGTIQQVEILEYREHYGGEIKRAAWREQFKGKSSSSKLKLHDTVSNISGATLSCRAITEGVRRLLVSYELLLRPRLATAARLPDPGKKD
jgi:hypothetical protein